MKMKITTQNNMQTKNKNNIGDGQSKTRLEQWEINHLMRTSQVRSGQYETHPESYAMRKISWEGMLTIRFESGTCSKENNDGQSARKNFIKLLMNNLRQKWGLTGNDVLWVYSTEYGISGVAHCHILFSFYPLIGKEPPNVLYLEPDAIESAKFISGYPDFNGSSVNVKWEPKFDNFGLIGYVCKKELGREEKHFVWSNDEPEWLENLFDQIERNTKEGNQ